MKLFRRRISRSAVLLFFNMVLVLVSALLVLVNMQARTELDESKRGFYSERASYLINEESSWEEIRDILLGDEWNNGIIFKKDLEMEADTRGVFYKGDFKKLPLISGRYFTEDEAASDEKKAMIGQRFVKDVYDEGGSQYIDILGEKFEVVGVLGSAQATRLDSMKWIPMAAAAELAGTEGEYVVDGKTEAAVDNNADLLKKVMEPDWTMEIKVMNDEGKAVESSFPERNNNVIEKIYLAIIFSFILNMILAGTYWGRHTAQRIQVEKMLGFSSPKILLSVLTEYLKIALAALAAAGALIGVLILCRLVVALKLTDFLLVVCGILVGEMLIAGAGLTFRIGSRKISLKRA